MSPRSQRRHFNLYTYTCLSKVMALQLLHMREVDSLMILNNGKKNIFFSVVNIVYEMKTCHLSSEGNVERKLHAIMVLVMVFKNLYYGTYEVYLFRPTLDTSLVALNVTYRWI